MDRRIRIQWTETARNQLAKLDPKVRKGILAKAAALRHCEDPRTTHKPLVGPLAGYFRIVYSRYRAIYTVEEERLVSGVTLIHLRVLFVAVGKRKERDQRDIYKIAKKFVETGLIDPEQIDENEIP